MADKIYFDATEVFENIDNFISDLPSKMARKTEEVTLFIEGESKKNCPVDDGLLRNSISHYVDIDEVGTAVTGYVGSNLGYAPFVHQGTGLYAVDGNGRKEVPWHYQTPDGQWHTTSGQKPNAFIQDSVDSNMGKLKEFFRGLLDE